MHIANVQLSSVGVPTHVRHYNMDQEWSSGPGTRQLLGYFRRSGRGSLEKK